MNRSLLGVRACVRLQTSRQNRFFSQQFEKLTNGAQETYIFYECEFSETEKITSSEDKLKKYPRVPLNKRHLDKGNSALHPYLQTAKPMLDLNPNLQSWLAHEEEGHRLVDCFALTTSGKLSKRVRKENTDSPEHIGFIFSAPTEGMCSIVSKYMSAELQQPSNPRAENKKVGSSGYKNDHFNAPTTFTVRSPWFPTDRDCLLVDYWSKYTGKKGEHIAHKMHWDEVEHFLTNENGRSQAFMNLVVTQLGNLHREQRHEKPYALRLKFLKYKQIRDNDGKESMERLSELINASWNSSFKWDLWENAYGGFDLNLSGTDAISDFLDWVGPCVVPGEQHRFVVGENGLP